MFCPKCGTKLPDGVKFCINCGTPITFRPETPAAPAPAPAAPAFKASEPPAEPAYTAPEAPAFSAFKTPEPFTSPAYKPPKAAAPEVPAVPEVPAAPEVPAPVEFQAPEIPAAPEVPEAPAYTVPEAPAAPAYKAPEPPAPPAYQPPEKPVEAPAYETYARAPQAPVYPQQPAYPQQPQTPNYPQQPPVQPERPVQAAPQKAKVKKRFNVGSMVILCFAALLMIGAAVLFFLMKTIRMDFEVIYNNAKMTPWNEFKLTGFSFDDTLMKILPYAIPGCLALGGLLVLLSVFVRSKVTCILGFVFGLLGVGGFVFFWLQLFKATEGTGWIKFLPQESGWTEAWFKSNNVAPTTTTMPALPFGWTALGCAGAGTLFALIASFIPMKKTKAE